MYNKFLNYTFTRSRKLQKRYIISRSNYGIIEMFRSIVTILLLVLSFSSYSESVDESSKAIVGVWDVVALKAGGQGEFTAPLQPAKWEFTENGKFLEKLGSGRAQINWNFKVENGNIKISFRSLKFSWKIISQNENELVVNHHLGIFKVKRI